MFGLPTKAVVYAAIAGAVLAGLTLIYVKGRTDAETAAKLEAANDAARIVKERAANDADLHGMTAAELCRELNGGVRCE